MTYKPGFTVKTKIKGAFSEWRWSNERVELYRFCFSKAVSVSVRTFTVELTERFPNRNVIGTGTDLADAIRFADNYIAENFEVEKPIEERLKDAEAEIVTLKAKVADLEKPEPEDDAKFKVGDVLTYFGGSWGTGKYEVSKVTKRDNEYRYGFKGFAGIEYPERVLILCNDNFKFKIGQHVFLKSDTCSRPYPIKESRINKGMREYTRMNDIWYPEDSFSEVK